MSTRVGDRESSAPASDTPRFPEETDGVCVEAPQQQDGPARSVNALRDAARRGDLDAIVRLLQDGLDLEADTSRDKLTKVNVDDEPVYVDPTPLHEAAAAGHAAVARALLAAGAVPDRLVCCSSLELDSTTRFYSIAPGAVMPHNQGLAPMHFAARFGHVDVVNALLESGADVNVRGSFLRDTPLHLAASHGHVGVLSLLLHKGAQLDAVDRCGGSALHMAESLSARQFLLEAGANPNLVMNAPWGQGTALRVVVAGVREGSSDAERDEALAHVKVLIEHGTSARCDANAAFRYPVRTSLHLSVAVFNGATAIVAAMLEAGFDPNQSDAAARGRGAYPIHHAARHGRTEILRLLLRAGSTLEVRDPLAFNSTPLHLGCRFVHIAVVQELLSWGADMSALDRTDSSGEGRTPAGVISLRKTFRPNDNSIANPQQEEDEQLLPEDAPRAFAIGNRSSRVVGSRMSIRGHLIGNRADARDRNLIRRALRSEERWRNRRIVLLFRHRVQQEPDLLSAFGVGPEQAGTPSPAQEVDAEGGRGSGLWAKALLGLLRVAEQEHELFRHVVRFL